MVGAKEKQQAHWEWVKDWGPEKFQSWLLRWDTELKDMGVDVDRFSGFTTLNIGGGPIPYRFKNAKEEILLDNNAEWFEPMYPKKYREGMTILNEDIKNTSIKSESVDVVYIRKTIEYIDDWQLVLRQIWRVLKPSGVLIMMFHEVQNDSINLNLLTKDDVTEYLTSIGFRIHFDKRDTSSTYVQIIGVKKVD